MSRRHSLAGGALALIAAAAAPTLAAAAAVEQQGGTPQLRLTTTSAALNVPAGQTVSRALLCPRGRTPVWWGFIGSTQTGRTVTAADLDSVLAIRAGNRAGLRVTFTGAAAGAVRAVVDMTCAQGRRGLVTRLTPRGRQASQPPTRPTLTVTSKLNSRRLAAGAAGSVNVLCRAGALASTYGFVERGASDQGAVPITRGARQGFRVRFDNRSAAATRVTAQAICHEVARLRRTTNRTVSVQRAAQVDGGSPAGTIARGYVTIDSVDTISTQFPNSDPTTIAGIPTSAQPGSPNGGGLRPEFDGAALWGDWQALPRNAPIGDSLVHIEAPPGGPQLDSDYTFYGRYNNGALGSQSGLIERVREGHARVPYLPVLGSDGDKREAQGPSVQVVGRITLSTPFLSATRITIVDARRPRPVTEIQPAPLDP